MIIKLIGIFMTQLDILKNFSTIVADTGNIESIVKYRPKDATTNPSIILQTIKLTFYRKLFTEAINFANKKKGNKKTKLKNASNRILINIGKEILKYIPGRVSTEVDARFSFDTEQCIQTAKNLIQMYEEEGINRNRVLIKLAATWEGVKAAKILESKNIKCNLTLLFSFAQAKICADANVYLISPFVGRIYDWYENNLLIDHSSMKNDPGVVSVKKIFNYYKKHNYKTIIMAASFRKVDQILELAGCDYLTIAPIFLEKLLNNDDKIKCKLTIPNVSLKKPDPISESEFRFQHNADAMAVEKLSEGIRMFSHDQLQLEKIIEQEL